MKDLQFSIYDVVNDITTVLIHEPEGWDGILLKSEREMKKYFGNFMSISVPLIFREDGRKYIRSMFYNYGTSGNYRLIIEKRDIYTNEFETVYTGRLDFSTFKDDQGLDKMGVEISLIDMGLANSLRLYEGTDFKITIPVTNKLQFSGIASSFETVTQLSRANDVSYGSTGVNEFYYLGMMGDHNFRNLNGGYLDIKYDSIDGCNIECLKPCSIKINTICSTREISLLGVQSYVGGNIDFVLYEQITLIKASGTRERVCTLAEYHITATTTPTDHDLSPVYANADLLYNGTNTIDLEAGDKLAYGFYCHITSTGGIYDYTFVLDIVNDVGSITQKITIIAPLPDLEFNVISAYDLAAQLVEKIHPGAGFKSDFLSELSDIDTSNNRFLGLCTPKNVFTYWIGGVATYYDYFYTNLDSFMHWLNSIYCVGLGIEIINGVDTFVIEKREYFLNQDAATIYIGEVSNLSVTPTSDMIPNSIKVGFADRTYSENFGQFELISNIEMTTPQKDLTNEESYIESKYRMDFTGFDDVRKKNIDQFINNEDSKPVDTADVDGSNDLFAFDCSFIETVGGVNYFELRREITVQTSWVTYSDKFYNLEFTAYRNLLRHNNWIDSILAFYENKYMTVTKTNKVAGIETLKPGESVLWEDSGMQLGQTWKIFLPLYFDFDCVLSKSFEDFYLANPNCIIEFSSNGNRYYGYILIKNSQLAMNRATQMRLLCAPKTDLQKLII